MAANLSAHASASSIAATAVTTAIQAQQANNLEMSKVEVTPSKTMAHVGGPFIKFIPIAVAKGADKARNTTTTGVQVSRNASTNGDMTPSPITAISYHVLLRTNQELPRLGDNASTCSSCVHEEKERFGLLKLANGAPWKNIDGSDAVCTNGAGPDYTALIQHGEALFTITQLECPLGGAYVTKLQQAADGTLTPQATRSVDFSKVFGTYVNCAGSITPWNTFLGSEEYEPPMAKLNPNAVAGAWFNEPAQHNMRMAMIAEYNGLPNDAAHAQTFGYYHGWVWEITITSANGDTAVDKHFAMGRFSHELAYVMPDQRTVYLSDDGTNVGLFLFVADKPQDLSAGTLYAAKWQQITAEGVGTANLQWINLGHATNAEMRSALQAGITFNDMRELAVPTNTDTATCPSGFTSTNAYDAGFLCVKLKSTAATLASRLETRLYAAYRGATTEFRKEEGLTYNSDQQILYVAMTELTKSMEDGSSNDKGGANHIRLKANKCGAVYGAHVKGGVVDDVGQPINSNFVAVDMYGVIAGSEKAYADGELAANSCDLDKIANPDNIAYLPKYGALLIGEDTNKHQNDVLWSYDVKTGRLDRIASTPYGAEATSPYWFPNIGGYGYITIVTQHPYGESDGDLITDPHDKESYVGYIGPLPRLD